MVHEISTDAEGNRHGTDGTLAAKLSAALTTAQEALANLQATIDTLNSTAGVVTVSLLGPSGTMFKRRAVKNAMTENASEVCWLVAELSGVKVYQNGNHIVVTEQDMYP